MEVGMLTREAALALHHFGLGARPGELASVADPRAWLLGQLDTPAAFALPAKGLPDRVAAAEATLAADEDDGEVSPPRLLLRAELAARLAHAVHTPYGFAERLVAFWSNHFTVSVQRKTAAWIGLFEREVIRGGQSGRFEDLLLAAARHPAMLFYLDQAGSIGPGSLIGARRERGLNENLAREILELHTLGVQGGYTQADVTELARALTGWTVRMPRTARFGAGPLGDFLFVGDLHEPGARELLGQRYPEDGERQADAMLRALARHPSTARHLATKLARHFVADAPPEAAIAQLERAFRASDGHLPTVHAALVDMPEAWSQHKHRAPIDFVIAAQRALAVEAPAKQVGRALADLGQTPARAPSPAGWPDTRAEWAGGSSLLRRVAWAEALAARCALVGRPSERLRDVLGPLLADATAAAVDRASSAIQGLTLGLMSPEFQRR